MSTTDTLRPQALKVGQRVTRVQRDGFNGYFFRVTGTVKGFHADGRVYVTEDPDEDGSRHTGAAWQCRGWEVLSDA